MTRNYFEKNSKLNSVKTTQQMSKDAMRFKQELQNSEKDFKTKVMRYNFLESLILAQDERWRRA